jgi:hypothetical protein
MGATKCYFFKADDVLRGRSHKIYGHAITGITLNNTGDWLILYVFFENSLTDSGGDYGPADKGASLAVFGDDYMWTNSLTPGAANVFTSTEEIDDDKPAAIKKKVTKSKVVKASKKSVVSKAVVGTNNEDLDEDEASVKAAKSGQTTESLDGGSISKKTLGYGLIGLAILLVVGYTLWYFRDYAKEIYYKIRPGDDSARF